MDWQLTCRICLETGDMVSLFDWDENNEQLGDKYTYCCGVEVTKDDTLPTLICLNCVDRLTFAYQFKQQCLSSNDTLKECLEEFVKSTASTSSATEEVSKETITIKQENGMLLQYDLPIEHESPTTWKRILSKTTNSSGGVVTVAPPPRKRGRPRKYPDEHGHIDVSPYQRKKPKVLAKEPESLTSLIASSSLEVKLEPHEDNDLEDAAADDPDYNESNEDEKSENQTKKRGRTRKGPVKSEVTTDDCEDVLLKETIMAFSEPIPDHILNPKPKKKYKKTTPKKKYHYDKTHVCETCGASFSSNATLQTHIRRHLGIKPFVCSICGYACVLNMELRRHMMRHTGVKPYKCRVCERRFGDFGSRQKHESICGFTCAMRQGLRRHMFRHTGEMPYKCSVCDRQFRCYSSRQKHERLHMGLRPYECKVCGKTFTYSYVLANHMLTHTGEKKYACVPCNKKFTKAHHLKYHNKVHHKDLYYQQQLQAEAKKLRQQMNVTGLSGVLSGQIVDGTLTLIHAPSEDGEQETQMQVVVEQEDEENLAEQETDAAVANMQADTSLDEEEYTEEYIEENENKEDTIVGA